MKTRRDASNEALRVTVANVVIELFMFLNSNVNLVAAEDGVALEALLDRLGAYRARVEADAGHVVLAQFNCAVSSHAVTLQSNSAQSAAMRSHCNHTARSQQPCGHTTITQRAVSSHAVTLQSNSAQSAAMRSHSAQSAAVH